MADHKRQSVKDLDTADLLGLDMAVEPRAPHRSLANSGIVGTGNGREPWRVNLVNCQLHRAVQRGDIEAGKCQQGEHSSAQGEQIAVATSPFDADSELLAQGIAFWPGQRSA